jgi:hypothetical protein
VLHVIIGWTSSWSKRCENLEIIYDTDITSAVNFNVAGSTSYLVVMKN